jgi:hypothetical protein
MPRESYQEALDQLREDPLQDELAHEEHVLAELVERILVGLPWHRVVVDRVPPSSLRTLGGVHLRHKETGRPPAARSEPVEPGVAGRTSEPDQ